MKRWGLQLLVLGLGIFTLPVIEPHLRSINTIGNLQPIAASMLVVVGAIVLTFAMMHSDTQ